MSDKLTPWFPARTKPIRGGLYRVRYPNDKRRRLFWALWLWTAWTAGYAQKRHALKANIVGGIQAKEWRGVAKGA